MPAGGSSHFARCYYSLIMIETITSAAKKPVEQDRYSARSRRAQNRLGQRNRMWFESRLARQNDGESRSNSDLAADNDLAAVVFDQFFGQRQSQSDTSLF